MWSNFLQLYERNPGVWSLVPADSMCHLICWFLEVCKGKSILREFSGSLRVRRACLIPNITLFWFRQLQVLFPNCYKDTGSLWTSPSHWIAFPSHCTERSRCPTCWPEPLGDNSCADHGLMWQKPRTQCMCSPKITTSYNLRRSTYFSVVRGLQ